MRNMFLKAALSVFHGILTWFSLNCRSTLSIRLNCLPSCRLNRPFKVVSNKPQLLHFVIENFVSDHNRMSITPSQTTASISLGWIPSLIAITSRLNASIILYYIEVRRWHFGPLKGLQHHNPEKSVVVGEICF